MKYLGVDFGLKRVGLAISEGQLASPLKVVEIRSLDDAVVKIFQITESEKIDQVVVGMPEGKTGKLFKKFIKKLQKENVNVMETDETLSSKQALEDMIIRGIPRKKRRVTDATVAAIILQNWLDNR